MLSTAFVFYILGSFIKTTQSSTTAKATFNADKTGIEGIVGALGGFMWMDLDFSGVDWSALPTNCSVGGLSYHIHEEWTWGDDDDTTAVDRMGENCSYAHTGNHYDPWYACGPKSDEDDCEVNGGCIPASSVYNDIAGFDLNPDGDYVCTPSNYSDVAYACEVGDLSGKYGKIMFDMNSTDPYHIIIEGNDTYGSYWEVDTPILSPNNKDAARYSLVIHCNDGSRAFCAAILRGNAASSEKDLTDDQTIETVFDDAGSEYEGMSIKWTNSDGKPAVNINIPKSANDTCGEWNLYLYNSWYFDAYARGITAGINCDLSQFEGIYDPTHSCINGSSSMYCEDGVRCKDTSATQTYYSCSAVDDYFGCAVGDMSGRFGSVRGQGEQTIIDPKSPPLFTLGNKVIVFECADATSDVRNLCALTEQTNGSNPFVTEEPPDDAAVNQNYFIVNSIIMLIFVFTSFTLV